MTLYRKDNPMKTILVKKTLTRQQIAGIAHKAFTFLAVAGWIALGIVIAGAR